jgi:hypothetical protein
MWPNFRGRSQVFANVRYGITSLDERKRRFHLISDDFF